MSQKDFNPQRFDINVLISEMERMPNAELEKVIQEAFDRMVPPGMLALPEAPPPASIRSLEEAMAAGISGSFAPIYTAEWFKLHPARKSSLASDRVGAPGLGIIDDPIEKPKFDLAVGPDLDLDPDDFANSELRPSWFEKHDLKWDPVTLLIMCPVTKAEVSARFLMERYG